MEYGSIERELHIDASPDVVFEVVSRPEHIKDWWGADTAIEPSAGSSGELVWEGGTAAITVVDVQPPRLFSFRWTHEAGQEATPDNSLLVTFELEPSGDGTLLRLTETGFRERGWELAQLEKAYQEHVVGWDRFVPRIGEVAERVAA